MHPVRKCRAPGGAHPGGAQRRIAWLYVDGLHGTIRSPLDHIYVGGVVDRQAAEHDLCIPLKQAAMQLCKEVGRVKQNVRETK